jgi:hypothetical protein
MSCPAILCQRPLELERRVAFLLDTLVMGRGDVMGCPEYLAASLMQVGAGGGAVARLVVGARLRWG